MELIIWAHRLEKRKTLLRGLLFLHNNGLSAIYWFLPVKLLIYFEVVPFLVCIDLAMRDTSKNEFAFACWWSSLYMKSVVEEGPNKFWSTNCGKLLLNNEKFTPDLFRFGIHCDHFACSHGEPSKLPSTKQWYSSILGCPLCTPTTKINDDHTECEIIISKSGAPNSPFGIIHALKWEEAGKEAFLKSHWIIVLMVSVYVLKAPNAKKHQIQGTDVASTIILDIIPISMHFK